MSAGGAGAADGDRTRAPARRFVPRQVVVKFAGEAHGRTVGLPRGAGVLATARALRAKPDVEYAQPNYVASGSAVEPEPVDPDDPGTIEAGADRHRRPTPGGWALRQWDFLDYSGNATAKLPTSPGGIDAVGAWANLEAAGRPGGKGIIVAVLDSGIAYRDWGSTNTCAAPTSPPEQFVPGEDFVDHDQLPLDENGHGTHRRRRRSPSRPTTGSA